MKKVAYVTNTDSNDISVVDLELQKEIGRIPIGGSPRGCMIIDSRGLYGYVSNCAGNTISILDLISNRETARIEVGLAPRGVALSPNGQLLFVSNSGSADVSVIDIQKREEITRIPVGDNPRALSVTADGKYVCVPCWGADSVSFIAINYENPMSSIEAFRVPLGPDSRPYHAMADFNDNYVYTANTHRHSVSVIDLTDMNVIHEIPVGFGPRGIFPDPSEPYIYVSCEASNVVSIVNKVTWSEEKQVPVGPTPRGMRLDNDERILYVTAFTRTLASSSISDANSLSVVDLRKREKVGTIKTGLGPCSVNIYDPAFYRTADTRKELVSTQS